MASYSIEDIELIRRKSGISYQEAVALLDYHNGNVARALVDLERNGRIKPEEQQTSAKPQGRNAGGLMNLLHRLYQFRLKVRKDQVTIVNLSLLFSLVVLMISPHTVLLGLIVALILGYRISFDRRDADFTSVNLEKMVRTAGENVRETVSDFTRSFQDKEPAPGAAPAPQQEQQQPAAPRSYYTANPAASAPAAGNPMAHVPTIQVPVQVESQDGHVTLETDRDGYNSATVE